MTSTKMWVKNNANSTWSETKRMWVKTNPDTIWQRVRKVWAKTSSTVWKLVFSGGDLPISNQNDPISIRYDSYSGTKLTLPYAFIGGPDSNGNDTQSLASNYYLYGDDGSYTNYTSITDRRFKYAYPTINDVLGTLEDDDILNTKSNMIVAENCYIWYTLRVWNGSDSFDSVEFEAGPVYMIKQDIYSNSYTGLTGTQAIGNTIYQSFNFQNYWYNSPDPYSSYIAWYRSSDGYTLGSPVKIQYLYEIDSVNTTTQISGSSSYNITAADEGYYIVAKVYAVNSYTDYFMYPYEYDYSTDGPIGAGPPENTSAPYFELINGTAGQVGATYRFYPGTWTNPNTGSTLEYRYILDKNNISGTNVFTHPGTTTFTSNSYYDYTFNNAISDTMSFYVLAYNGAPSLNYAFATTTFPSIQQNYQAAGNMRRVTMPIAFTGTSQNVWVSTNGFVGTTVDPGTAYSYPSSGLFVGPFVGDLKQTSLTYLSDASNFYVRWQGHKLGDSTQTVDYLIKFYWSSTTVDVYFITNNLSTLTPSSTAVQYGGSPYQFWSGSTAISGMSIPSGMISNTSQNNVDDGNTLLTAQKPTAPTIITQPTVSPSSGAAGTTFTSTSGDWTGSPYTYLYQWKYNDQGSLWLSIPGATSYQYTTPTNYVSLYGTGLRCYVTARNTVDDSTPAYNSNTVTVSVPVSKPSGGTVTLSGTAQAGQTITATTSGWSGSPTSYDLRIVRGTQYVIISETLKASSTSSSVSYTIQAADVGYYFKAFAYASNSAGTSDSYAQSNEIGPVTSAGVAPTISSSSISPGSGTAGSTTFTALASVSGTPTPSVSYQWQYLSTSFSYVPISGATSSTYTPPSNFNTIYPNYGFYCLITASNASGTATARPTATLNSPASGSAPSTPTGLSNSYSSGPSWTGSWSPSTGTGTITYYWTLYQSSTKEGAITTYAQGSTTGTSFTRSMNSSNGLWAYFTVYASNAYGTSGTATSQWA